MESYDLNEMNFMRKIMELMSDQLEVGEGKPIEQRAEIKEFAEASVYDQYIRTIFGQSVAILDTYEYLCFIPIFIRRFPIKKYYNENGIDRPKFLRYHMENHFLKISTIFDQSVTLVSEIFRLGVPPKYSSMNFLKHNSFTKNSNAFNILKKFSDTIQEIKHVRNLITHRGKFSDEDIDEIGNYYFLMKNAPEGVEPIIHPFLLEYKTKKVVKNKHELLINNNLAVNHFIFGLFSSLENEFDTKLENIKS